MSKRDQLETAASYWNAMITKKTNAQARWWARPAIQRYINARVCGQPIQGLHAGFHQELQTRLPEGCAQKAVSVGCGAGQKEISLVKRGLVSEFHLYEISSERVNRGRELAEKQDVGNRVHFHLQDAFEVCTDTDFDMVYWNNALHHMMDTRQAVSWSKDRLKQGGMFAMDDFIGAQRFQWSDRLLGWANRFRATLDDRFFENPGAPGPIPREVKKHSIEGMIKIDPSEAADSENILPAIRASFESPEIHMTGGAIYSLGMNRILVNIDEEEDADLLFAALLLDETISEAGENHYAVAFAIKD